MGWFATGPMSLKTKVSSEKSSLSDPQTRHARGLTFPSRVKPWLGDILIHRHDVNFAKANSLHRNTK